ncbi:MAG: ribulose-phosphate 3-epimerase [Saccharofermentanales bacterium]
MIKSYSDYIAEGKKEVIICPSILSADFTALGKDIELVSKDADWIHVDVMDGVFVPNISIGIPVVKAIRKITSLPLDVHLMIIDPIRYVDDFADAGADLIVVHAEACTHLHRVVQYIRSLGVNVGVSINPATSLSTIEEILPFVDVVLLMSVNPGFGGQAYIETVTSKISKLRKIMDDNSCYAHIQVDGGIGLQTIRSAFDAGANAFVVGNAVYGTDDPVKAIKELRACLE